MQTATAVFLAFLVIYAGTLVAPFEVSTQIVGWSAQAVSMTGAVATFMMLKTRGFDVGMTALVLAGMTVVTTLSAMAIAYCIMNRQCQSTVAVHSTVLSVGSLAGTAAYLGFLISSRAGLPLWAAVVVALASAPLFIGFLMPQAARGIEAALARRE